MVKNSENLNEEIVKAHKHYRSIAGFTTATVIVFASAILGWATIKPSSFIPENSSGKITLFILGFSPIFIAILSGVIVQWLTFWGYLKEARETHQGKSSDKNTYFKTADYLTHFCVVVFLLGFLTIAVFFSIEYFT